MNIEKIKKDSKDVFDNLCKFFDDDKNNIKKCFYYLLFKDLIQIKDEEYKNINSKDYVENSNSILLHYLDNIYFKISNNQPELLPILKENIIKKNNEIKLKLKECESHINILKKIYDNILLLEYIPITNDIKFLFENKTVLNISEPENFNIILSEFIARYIFSSINKENNKKLEKSSNLTLLSEENSNEDSVLVFEDNSKGTVENNLNSMKIHNQNEMKVTGHFPEFTKENTEMNRSFSGDSSLFSGVSTKEKTLEDIFNPKNFYSKKRINSYIQNNTIVKFNFIDNNFKYWYVLITLIGQIISKNSKYEIIFNKIERNKYINNILTPPKKEDNKKKNVTKKKVIKRGGYKKVLQNVLNKYSKDKKPSKIPIPIPIPGKVSGIIPGIIQPKILNSSSVKKVYNSIFALCHINNSDLKTIYIDSYKNNIKDYFIDFINNTYKDDYDYNKDSELLNPFNRQRIKLNKIINIKDKETINKKDLINRINHGEIIFDIFEFLTNYLDPSNIKEIDDFISKVKKKLILILYKLYQIKSVIYKNYISIINSLFDLNNNTKNTKKNNQKNNTTFGIKKLNNKKNNKSEDIIIKKQIEQNILNNSSINITVKIKLLTNKISELNSKPGIVHYDIEKLQLEDELKKLIIEKYNKKHK